MVDTEPDEGKTGDNNESESLEGIIESDQAVETNAKVAEDQELLKVLPENEEEKEKDEIVTGSRWQLHGRNCHGFESTRITVSRPMRARRP